MDYKFLFLVGSALNHFQEEHFSRFSKEERFEQTLKTIQSIKEKVPDAYILVYEGSETPIEEKYKNILIENSDLFLECGTDSYMKSIYENIHRNPDLFTFGKSLLECRCLQVVLEYMMKHNVFNDATRIFKITGRYFLNDNFDINDYKTKFLANKYVMKYYDYKKRFENMDDLYVTLYGCGGNTVTGLWSFDKFLFLDIFDVLTKSFQYMERAIRMTAGIDIEHSFYHFIDRDKIVNISNLGLSVIKGMKGQNGGEYDI
jgi:hypothetical protein